MSGGKDVEVPDVTNETKADASQALQSAGLKVDSETKKIPDDKIEEGKVVKTDPEAKSSVKKGRSVTLYISSGTEKIEMADYTNESYESAVEALKKLGFSEDQITTKKNTVILCLQITLLNKNQLQVKKLIRKRQSHFNGQ